MRAHKPLILALAAWTLALSSTPSLAKAQESALPFTPREAEHLLNRAGFGAGPDRVQAAVDAGLSRTLEELFHPRSAWRDPFFAEDLTPGGKNYRQRLLKEASAQLGETPEALKERFGGRRPTKAQVDELMSRQEQQKLAGKLRAEDRLQLEQYSQYWVGGLLGGIDPLRDRMTLFWMGLLTSSNEDVKNSYEMIGQHQFLRDKALGSYKLLLNGIARDPAMLEYLDNDENKKRAPNENFARELLELFALGEGHYTEADILAAARAFTGWTDRDGEFVFQKNNHDREPKTFLGRTGDLDGEDILEILLEQPRCARYLSDRLIEYFEGQAPSETRAAAYAELLFQSGYQLVPFLQALFSDGDFYRDSVVGNRIQSPIDFLVGTSTRLGLEPPARLLELGIRALGQRPFYPPSVKGWDEGRAWITTSSMLQRANLAGVLLGTVGPEELLARSEELDAAAPAEAGEPMMGEDSMQAADSMAGDGAGDSGRPRRPLPGLGDKLLKRSELFKGLQAVQGFGWQPQIYLAARLDHRGAKSDHEVVLALAEELLARPIEPASLEELAQLLTREREAIALPEGQLYASGQDGEHLVRKLAHAVLSLPEAQLN